MLSPLELFKLETTALIVVDKQAAYMDQEILESRDLNITEDFGQKFKSLEDFIVLAREKGIKIVWTKMTEDPKLSGEPIRQKMIYDRDIRGLKLIKAEPGKPDYELVGKILPIEGEAVTTKTHYDAFSNPELSECLRGNGITAVILVGGFTSRCVLGTAYGANNNDFYLLLLEDLLITPKQFTHEVPATLSLVGDILGYVSSSKELLDSWT